MRKDFFTPPGEGKGGVKKTERESSEKGCRERRRGGGGKGRRDGERRGKRGWGLWLRLSEMLTHSHAGLSRLFLLTLPAPEKKKKTKTHPVYLPSPPCSLLGRLQEYTMLAVTEFPYTALIPARIKAAVARMERRQECALFFFLRSNVCTHTKKKEKRKRKVDT